MRDYAGGQSWHFEKERFRAFAQAGSPARPSAQSFNDGLRQALGVHDRAQALAAVEEAARSFGTFNLDLMYALPGQDMAQLDDDLDTAPSMRPRTCRSTTHD